MKFKHFALSIVVVVVAAFGIISITQATLQTIADIPQNTAEKRMQLRLKIEKLLPSHTYIAAFESGETQQLSSDENGQIDQIIFVPDAWLDKKKITFQFHPVAKNDNTPPAFFINAEIDMKTRQLSWEGNVNDIISEHAGEHEKAEIVYSNNPLASSVTPDWSGKFYKETSLPDTLKPGVDICLDIQNTDIGLCISLNIFSPVETTQALTPSGFNLVYSFISDDPISVFDVWIVPEDDDCKPYKAELSVCKEGHMMRLYEGLWKKPIYDMQRMTLQISALMMQQVGFIGTLIDAKIQLETQLLFWEKQEEAHDKYHPSEQMCTLTTLTEGLASSEKKRDLTTFALARAFYFDDNNLINTMSSIGDRFAKEARFWDFTARYCNPYNMGETLNIRISGIDPLCQSLRHGDIGRINRDMNYTEFIETPLSLNVDVSDGLNSSADEEDVISMARNLYGSTYINFPQPTDSEAEDLFTDPDLFTHGYQRFRSISAIRNAARYSFANIVGMKSVGSGVTNDYIKELLTLFGMSDDDITRFVGDNPSYFAQMNVLTKSIFQHPQFYTELIDKPANIARFETTMEALGLMHKRDQFEGQLRKEMLLSLLVELKLRELQDTEINRNLKTMGFGAEH